jgi:hypothetical protein
MTSAAEATREAVRAQPFLHEALRAGVVNFRAAAELLDVDADPGTVAAALRRYAEDLPARTVERRRVRVTVRRGVGVEETEAGRDGEGLLRVGDAAVVADGGATAFLATGDVDAAALGAVLARLRVEGVDVVAAAVGAGTLVVVVDAGTRTLEAVEDALAREPLGSGGDEGA